MGDGLIQDGFPGNTANPNPLATRQDPPPGRQDKPFNPTIPDVPDGTDMVRPVEDDPGTHLRLRIEYSPIDKTLVPLWAAECDGTYNLSAAPPPPSNGDLVYVLRRGAATKLAANQIDFVGSLSAERFVERAYDPPAEFGNGHSATPLDKVRHSLAIPIPRGATVRELTVDIYTYNWSRRPGRPEPV